MACILESLYFISGSFDISLSCWARTTFINLMSHFNHKLAFILISKMKTIVLNNNHYSVYFLKIFSREHTYFRAFRTVDPRFKYVSKIMVHGNPCGLRVSISTTHSAVVAYLGRA